MNKKNPLTLKIRGLFAGFFILSQSSFLAILALSFSSK